ncbi:chromosome segregation protein [Carpediemonas membranifera]|uniref:Chromosome segregation protein n=1 Tax=Carpediemonas membranifera TaxID=201153 RepID=A0A8J6E2U6_9EUKA|nr:chromosome segregation protein [Carpediemonas membranifera]|eukprot:KAG9395108.1 chromosome segregation protein [Carpediemonas membranifera]
MAPISSPRVRSPRSSYVKEYARPKASYIETFGQSSKIAALASSLGVSVPGILKYEQRRPTALSNGMPASKYPTFDINTWMNLQFARLSAFRPSDRVLCPDSRPAQSRDSLRASVLEGRAVIRMLMDLRAEAFALQSSLRDAVKVEGTLLEAEVGVGNLATQTDVDRATLQDLTSEALDAADSTVAGWARQRATLEEERDACQALVSRTAERLETLRQNMDTYTVEAARLREIRASSAYKLAKELEDLQQDTAKARAQSSTVQANVSESKALVSAQATKTGVSMGVIVGVVGVLVGLLAIILALVL